MPCAARDLLEVDVPDLHRPVRRAADEYLRMKMIPTNGVDGHVMRLERLQELIGVGLRALVNFPLLGTDDEEIILMPVEVEASSTACRATQRERGSQVTVRKTRLPSDATDRP